MAKPSLIDLKGFRKTAEDQHKATLTHEAGHSIHLAKAALSPELQKQLSKLPLHQYDPKDAIADPGQVDSPDAQGQVLPGADSPGPGIPGGALNVAEDAYATPRQEMQGQPTPTPPPAPDRAPDALPDPNEAINGMPGGAEALQGANMQAQATKTQASTDAALQQDYAKHQQAAEDELKGTLKNTTDTINQVTSDIQNGHIDPKHYLDNMSSGSKIATAIGLIAGGIGSARTGGQNPAMAFLQSQIQRDIDAQKANLGNKHNLLSALENQYGNKTQAAHVFAAIDANVLASKLAATASTAASPMAEASRLAAVGALKQTAAQYQRQAVLAGMQSSVQNQPPGAGMDARANMYLQAARIMDPKGAEEFEKRYIPGVGVSSVPVEPKDRELLQKKTELSELLNRAQESIQGNKGYGALPLTQKHAEAQSLQNQLVLRMGELADLTRFTPEEHKIYAGTVPDLTGTHFTSKDATLLKGLKDSNDSTLNTFFKQKGIQRQAGDSDQVKVLNANGQSGNIPRSQLKQALKSGYKLVQ